MTITAAQIRAGIKFIARKHQGMLDPMRFKCISVAAGLPVNAPR